METPEYHSRKHRLYTIRKGMKQRCLDPGHKAYHRYGGRGIRIAPQWIDDHKAFADWSIANGYADGLTIDRIDNDGDYQPSNCRWVDRKAQIRNSTVVKLSMEEAAAIRAAYETGETTMRKLATQYGVVASAIHRVVHRQSWV
jgi:hypothetical protein